MVKVAQKTNNPTKQNIQQNKQTSIKSKQQEAETEVDVEDEDEDGDTDTDTNDATTADYDDDDSDSDDDDDSDGEVIDLSSADENAKMVLEVMPQGRYLTEVIGTEFVEFTTGSKGMKVTLEVAKGNFAKSAKRKSGRKLYINLVLSAAAADILKTNLKGLGVSKKLYNSPEFSAKILRRIADSGDLIGNRCYAEVKIKTYNGEKNNEVRGLKPATEDDDIAEGGQGFIDED
jgi:Protein of unknown function (DUF669)